MFNMNEYKEELDALQKHLKGWPRYGEAEN